MSSSTAAILSAHESLSVFLPTTLLYTAIWSCLFLLYQRVVLPELFRLSSSSSSWYSSLPTHKQRNYLGRLLFSIHHLLVSYYATAALTATDGPTAVAHMRATMYHEVAVDVFDVVVIACTEKGFTGLHWQGLLLHHLLSVVAILASFTLHLPLALTAQFGLLLDGTGAVDYFFNTLVFHTPLTEYSLVRVAASACTLVFFASRLFYFPWLAWQLTCSGWREGGVWTGVVCGATMALTCFFNVGMIKTRWRQHQAMWRQTSRRNIKANMREVEQHEMEDKSSIVL